jgi:hypothetical protein
LYDILPGFTLYRMLRDKRLARGAERWDFHLTRHGAAEMVKGSVERLRSPAAAP